MAVDDRSAVASRQVTLSHGRTRYLEAGSGPTVLLLHGVLFHAAAESWLPVVPGLAEQFHVIAPDFVGWGPGDQLDQGYSFAYLVDFVRELQDALAIERCHVVGHSMGGWVAALLAYESPHRVEQLVLAANGGLAVRPLASMQAWEPPHRDEIAAHFAPYAAAGVDVEPLIAAALERAGDPGRCERFARIMAHMTDAETRRRYELGRRLPHVVAPTLLLWGADDAVNPPALAEQAAHLLPDARVVVLPGAGHQLQVDAPRPFVAAVRAFLPSDT
jgi:pimeloyl-ACP methyl ester carboxylesterase